MEMILVQYVLKRTYTLLNFKGHKNNNKKHVCHFHNDIEGRLLSLNTIDLIRRNIDLILRASMEVHTLYTSFLSVVNCMLSKLKFLYIKLLSFYHKHITKDEIRTCKQIHVEFVCFCIMFFENLQFEIRSAYTIEFFQF